MATEAPSFFLGGVTTPANTGGGFLTVFPIQLRGGVSRAPHTFATVMVRPRGDHSRPPRWTGWPRLATGAAAVRRVNQSQRARPSSFLGARVNTTHWCRRQGERGAGGSTTRVHERPEEPPQGCRRPCGQAPGCCSPLRTSQEALGSSDVGMAAAFVAPMRDVVAPSRSLGVACLPHQGGVRAAADETVTTAEVAPPPPMSLSPMMRPHSPTPASRPNAAQSPRTLTNFRIWVLCDGPIPLVARFVLASFDIPEDGGVDAVRRALRASALAIPPYNVFVRPWARVAYVKAAEVGDGIRRLDNKQSDTMRELLAEEARSPGGMVLCVEQTRNPKYKGGLESSDTQGLTTVRSGCMLTLDGVECFQAGLRDKRLGRGCQCGEGLSHTSKSSCVYGELTRSRRLT